MPAKSDSASAAMRAFRILEAVVAAERSLTLTEVMNAVGLAKPTVWRLLTLLEGEGLLLREPGTRAYAVGPRLARFGMGVMMNGTVRATRHAILQRLVTEIGETCNLTMQEGGEVIYLDRVESSWPLRIDLQPGSRVPLHCSASGKLFMSLLPKARRRALVASLALERFTPNTITDPALLEAELERVRASRVGVDNEEYLAGLVCVAVPVLCADGRCVASLALQAPAARLTLPMAMEQVPALRRAAEQLAATFEPPAAPESAPRAATAARRSLGTTA